MSPRFTLILLWIVFFLPVTSLSSPYEAKGTVTSVFDGDTFDVRIEESSFIAPYSTERINLADVDCPEMNTAEGLMAKSFTSAVLLNKTVWLDIDNLSSEGGNSGEELVCVVYLAGLDQLPISSPPFNKILVDSHNAVVEDFADNEFDPYEWWTIDEESFIPEFLITDRSMLTAGTQEGFSKSAAVTPESTTSTGADTDKEDDDKALEDKVKELEEENARLKQQIKELKEEKDNENKEDEKEEVPIVINDTADCAAT